MEGPQNNVNTVPPAPVTQVPPAAPVMKEETNSSGVIIAAVVILAVIVLGGLYFWGQRAGDEAMVENINTQSASDDTSSIEADLYDTDIDSIDAELNAS